MVNKLYRKAMNSFFCATDRPFLFTGRINEDVNAYVGLGRRGDIFFTYMPIQLNQLQTQSNAGGLTELYLDSGTYLKSYYTVMVAPSCVKINLMGSTNMRLHHRVDWNATAPKIVAERYRKAGALKNDQKESKKCRETA